MSNPQYNKQAIDMASHYIKAACAHANVAPGKLAYDKGMDMEVFWAIVEVRRLPASGDYPEVPLEYLLAIEKATGYSLSQHTFSGLK